MKLSIALNQQFVIPVLRQPDEKILLKTAEALIRGGMKVLEITLMSEAAFSVIKALSSQKDLLIGAGTVLNAAQVEAAVAAGASFLVSPGFNLPAVQKAQELGTPFIPGVMTPSEIMQAQAAGCELVKIFPAKTAGGSDYIKLLQGPFPAMQWMATGGLIEKDIEAYLNAGASCIGLGNQLAPKEMLAAKDWEGIARLSAEYLQKVSDLRSTHAKGP